MEVTATDPAEETNVWGGGNQPLNASYGKLMMWFFIVSDALTFSGFLVAYGFSRFQEYRFMAHCRRSVYPLPFLARCRCTHVLCGSDDLYSNFFIRYHGVGC